MLHTINPGGEVRITEVTSEVVQNIDDDTHDLHSDNSYEKT